LKQEFVSGELSILESGNIDSKINFKNNLRDGLQYEFNHYDTKGSVTYTATGLIQYAPSVDSTVYKIELKSDKVTFYIDGVSNRTPDAEIEEISEEQILNMRDLTEFDMLRIYANLGNSNIYKLYSIISGEDPIGEMMELVGDDGGRSVEPDEPEEPEWEEPEEPREPEQPEWEEPNPEEERNEEENRGEEENQEEIEVEEF
jgi:hypothetical protein